ncbi:hypothetical protein EJF18_20675 [Clavispora lusitaniae]|uniref:Uncharacterized protein n=1 Tax=Clavispora lusitaniae TaxID=36911 RepID=A0ACD0WH24_CLALS|nr:hypothetical protein EJF14_20675 [Clavispora lusitaniae]QFZ32425.1 hypothetical protein EJF16_20675 [Clavispora lusitaniae]QFZ38094.1 hypothetical protein EJF15_20675 [Clavispora lusitaniae]QFZ43777.1 hypothetical protein EJF18_20675 [Clavispora lusitaniae]QFZ49454.1 hypothetical protein EJF17_20675 [Clavispora lusitaniae]
MGCFELREKYSVHFLLRYISVLFFVAYFSSRFLNFMYFSFMRPSIAVVRSYSFCLRDRSRDLPMFSCSAKKAPPILAYRFSPCNSAHIPVNVSIYRRENNANQSFVEVYRLLGPISAYVAFWYETCIQGFSFSLSISSSQFAIPCTGPNGVPHCKPRLIELGPCIVEKYAFNNGLFKIEHESEH